MCVAVCGRRWVEDRSVCPSDLNPFFAEFNPILCQARPGDPTRLRNPPVPSSHGRGINSSINVQRAKKNILGAGARMVKAGPLSTDKGAKDDASLRTSECDYGVVASHSGGRRAADIHSNYLGRKCPTASRALNPILPLLMTETF